MTMKALVSGIPVLGSPTEGVNRFAGVTAVLRSDPTIVPGYADLVDGLPHDLKRLETLGHDGFGPELAAHALNPHLVAVVDAAQFGEFLAHFTEHLRLGLDEPALVAGHQTGLPVLGDAVGAADERETRIADRFFLGLELQRRGGCAVAWRRGAR